MSCPRMRPQVHCPFPLVDSIRRSSKRLVRSHEQHIDDTKTNKSRVLVARAFLRRSIVSVSLAHVAYLGTHTHTVKVEVCVDDTAQAK